MERLLPRNKIRTLALLSFLFSCGLSFTAGAVAYKKGWHRPILNKFYTTIDHTCNCKMVKGYCPCSSVWTLEPYENDLIDQVDMNVPDFSLLPRKGFDDLLKEAVGWQTFRLSHKNGFGQELITTKVDSYGFGVIETRFIEYSVPRLKLRFFHAKQSAENLVIVLHGHNSSALKVMGLDNIDYMRQAGKEWFRAGYDIIAFDLTTDGQKSSYLNSQLLLYGGQLFGLWSRVVCDTVETLNMHQKYHKIFIYGLSNGGVIADHISVLCGELFNKVISDDELRDWRRRAWKHKTLWGPQNYAIYYLGPLHARSSYIDFIVNSKTQKYYILREGTIEGLFPTDERRALNKSTGVDHNKKINFVKKRLEDHVTELDVVMGIFGERNDLTGYHLSNSDNY